MMLGLEQVLNGHQPLHLELVGMKNFAMNGDRKWVTSFIKPVQMFNLGQELISTEFQEMDVTLNIYLVKTQN